MPTNGKVLQEIWGIPAKQVLYHKDGTFFNQLKRFPGALCDAKGYVLFKTERDYKQCPELKIGKKVAVPGSIGIIPGYHLGAQRDEGIDEAAKTTLFSLERDLQKALRENENIQQLEEGLTISDGGGERNVACGRIDITAKDKRGATVVIELKVVEADKNAVAQVAAYMGALMGEGTRSPVRGILVAPGFKGNAIDAARAIPNLQLKKYGFRFSFEAANR